MNSITTQATTYYIKDVRDNTVYKVIDTPGFADTKGLYQDKENALKIQNVLMNEL